MVQMRCNSIKKYINLVGCILVQFPLGVIYLSGNVSPYIISYLYYHGKYGEDDLGTEVWITSLFFVGILASIVTSFLEKHIGIRWTVLVGVLIVDTSYFLTYFAVQNSIQLVSITMGLIPGIGIAQAMNATISNVAKWMPKKMGLVICLVATGFGTGVIFINNILTDYVNPLSVGTNITMGSIRLFSDKDVIDRTPSLFLLLGVIAVGFHAISIPMIINAPKEVESNDYVSLEESDGKHSRNIVTGKNSKALYSAYEMRLCEVLKQPATYILTTAGFLYMMTSIVILASYKTFGEYIIEDDALLTKVGSVAAFLGASLRPCFGLLADKISHKWTIILISGLAGIMIETIYFTRSIGAVAFSIWLTVIFILSGGAFAVFRSAIPKSFGIEHQSSNQTVLGLGYALAAFTTGPLTSFLLKRYGWFYVFVIMGSAPLIGALIMCFFTLKLPDGSGV